MFGIVGYIGAQEATCLLFQGSGLERVLKGA